MLLYYYSDAERMSSTLGKTNPFFVVAELFSHGFVVPGNQQNHEWKHLSLYADKRNRLATNLDKALERLSISIPQSLAHHYQPDTSYFRCLAILENQFIGEQFILADHHRRHPTLSVKNKDLDRKSTRLNSSHSGESRMPSSA